MTNSAHLPAYREGVPSSPESKHEIRATRSRPVSVRRAAERRRVRGDSSSGQVETRE